MFQGQPAGTSSEISLSPGDPFLLTVTFTKSSRIFKVKITKTPMEIEVQLPPEYTGDLAWVELSGKANVDFLGDIPKGK